MSTVYLGAWVNWQAGFLYGAQYTTTSSQALCLVSFLAIFIVVFGRHFWGILRFILHQLRVVRSPQDGLYHQEQVLLRNSTSPSAAFWEFLRIGWAWRGRAEYSLARVTPLILLAAAQVVVFTLAGVFSSGTFSVTNEVLVQSEACGYINYPTGGAGEIFNTTDWSLLNAAFVEDRTAATKSLAYSRTCYGDYTGSDCNYFIVPSIASNNATVACPFDDSMCLQNGGGALQMSSSVHSIEQLGINSKYDYGVTYNRVTTCAPLVTEGYQTWFKNAQGVDQYLEFFYGSYINTGNNEELPVTFAYDSFSNNYTATAYPVNYQFAALNDAAISTFRPIPQLTRTDGDVTLIFVFNNAKYTAPVTDPFYNATVPVPDVYGLGAFMYQAGTPVSVMGCVEQHQFCSSHGSSSCTALTGWSNLNQTTDPTYNETLPHIYSAPQVSILNVLKHAISNTLLSDMIFNLGSAALAATASVDGASTLLSAPLPNTQWMNEISGWHNYNMAHLQRLIASVATGPSVSSSAAYIVPPSSVDRAAFDICNNLKIIDPRYYSFSVSGMTIILIIGIAVIITNLALPRLVGTAQSLIGHGVHRREDWDHDHVLQLQRLAYEGAKLGTWSSREGGVPTTLQSLEGQKFGRPGKVVKAYEPLELAERGGANGMNVGGGIGMASPDPEAGGGRKGGFVDLPSVEVTGAEEEDREAMENPFRDGVPSEYENGHGYGGERMMHDDESYDMGARGLGIAEGTSARPSVEEAFYMRPGGGGAMHGREFI